MPKLLSDIQNTILASAEDLFKSRSYQEMDMREIAAHASIAVGTIYHYYKNKEALFMHVLAHSWQGTLQQLENISFRETNPDQALQDLLDTLILGMGNRRSMSSLWTEIATLYAGINPEHGEENSFSGMHIKISRCFSRVLTKMIPKDLSTHESILVDRLGSFAFVMAVDLCMLPESEANLHKFLLTDLLTTYVHKLTSDLKIN